MRIGFHGLYNVGAISGTNEYGRKIKTVTAKLTNDENGNHLDKYSEITYPYNAFEKDTITVEFEDEPFNDSELLLNDDYKSRPIPKNIRTTLSKGYERFLNDSMPQSMEIDSMDARFTIRINGDPKDFILKDLPKIEKVSEYLAEIAAQKYETSDKILNSGKHAYSILDPEIFNNIEEVYLNGKGLKGEERAAAAKEMRKPEYLKENVYNPEVVQSIAGKMITILDNTLEFYRNGSK